MVTSVVWAVPQLGSCTSSGRAWRLWAARHSQGEAGPLSALPLPRVRELVVSKAADIPALFDHAGAANTNHLDGAATVDAPKSAGPGARAGGRKRVAQMVSIASRSTRE